MICKLSVGLPEILKSMKGEIVNIVVGMRAFPSKPAHPDNIVTIKLPVEIMRADKRIIARENK